ncbi:hypothetical protein ONZ45_g16348 [Pleurotus djamor]|nr:hypothetical protein ONZ45_g16348 [Pleurotus djamor]
MVLVRLSIFTLFLSSALSVVASPFPLVPRDLPEEASQLAFDESTKQIIAFDTAGKLIGRFEPASIPSLEKRNGSPCAAMSKDEALKLPGWKKLEDAANQRWGTGKRNIVTNDKDLMDRPAQVCVDDGFSVIKKTGKADCEETTQSLAGKLVGSKGSVTLEYFYGTQYTSSNTVTKESALAVGTKVSAAFKLGDVLELGAEVTTTATFTNSLSSTETINKNTQSKSSLTMEAPKGKTCHLNFKHKSCTIRGIGNVRFVATGWVWFQYHSRTKGHYKWALHMDKELPKQDRSSVAEFKALVQSSTKSKFSGALGDIMTIS